MAVTGALLSPSLAASLTSRGAADSMMLEPGVNTIFNLHCPPHNTTLDRAPQLTDDLKVVLDGGEPRKTIVVHRKLVNFVV